MAGTTTWKLWMVTLCLLLLLPYGFVQRAYAEPARVLVVYDSLALGTPKEGNIEALKRVLASFGVEVTVTSFDRYKQGTLDKYQQVIGVRNADDLTELKAEYRNDFASYQGAYLHIGSQLPDKTRQALGLQVEERSRDTIRLSIGSYAQSAIPVNRMPYIVQTEGTAFAYGTLVSDSSHAVSPYGVMRERMAYVPYFEKGNLSELAIAYIVKDWLGVKRQSQNYVLFKPVYPFSNLEQMQRLADRLYESGIPFIVSAMPVFSNTDYPAMKRYLEALKYVQSRNGSILVNAPVVASTISQDITTLSDQMASFINALAEYGIAPLGIGAEMYWTYDQHYTARGMSYFDSIVTFPNERIMHRAQTDTSKAFSSSVYTLKAGELNKFEQQGKVREPFPMDTALVYDFPEDGKQFEQTLQALTSDWTTYADYKMAAHTVRTGANEAVSRQGQLQINGQTPVLNKAVKAVDSQHVYIQEGPKAFAAVFTLQNNIFIALILLTLLIFAGFLIIGHRLYRRKYTNQERSL
ncbi:DUF2334 domain-containing protein [Paenibacillus sp. H1-7]|uniref:DUF2334 domain-containing protein n=1 Tax=Paenibacillus sp. H1-7 TaxID=2282849 RepID=UPI001EF7F82E|nr:DUF2334 domain-containing protein [Paenibacillus sp. H1-7]